MGIKLSILDQSPIYEGESPEEALQHTIAIAQTADQLGYHRFWVSEHHDAPQLAGSSPEVLISHLLAKTERIRIGSGGVMLQHYSPYKVAENFNVLASLAPGRVDLGIGRAPGGLPNSTKALQGEGGLSRALDEKLAELAQLLHHRVPEDHPLGKVKAYPKAKQAAELYLLGTSVSSGELAAKNGLPYVFANFINSNAEVALQAITDYRTQFDASQGSKPEVIVAVSVIVAETDEEAQSLAGDFKQVRVTLASGKTVNLGTLEQAEEFARQANETYTAQVQDANIIKGDKETVRRELLALQERYGFNEVIVVTLVKDFEKRKRSLTLLQEAFAEVTAEG